IGDAAKIALRKTFENVLEAGVIVCAAAGNDGNSVGVPNNVDVPASCPPPYLHPDQTLTGGLSSVVCVGAVNSNDEYASFSSQGPSTWGEIDEWNDYPFNESNIGLIRPDIVAPGELIYSLKHDNNDKYKFNTGTSQATPCVAGVMALMLEKNPSLTPAEICEIIETTAVKLSDKKNNATGSGRIDALNAINEVEAVEGKPYIRLSAFSPNKTPLCSNLNISATLKNYGNGKNSNTTTVTLSTNDPYITITNATQSLGSINKNEEEDILFSIAIDAATPNGHIAYFKVTTTDGELVWFDEFSITIESVAKILFESKSVDTIKAGEVVSFNVEMINSGTTATTENSSVSLSSSSPYVSIIEGEATLSPMEINEKEAVNFSIKVDKSIPNNSLINLDLNVTPNDFKEINNFIYEFEIGKDRYGYYEDGLDGWTTFDASDDGRDHAWSHSSLYTTHKIENIGTLHSGKGCMMSETYCQASLIEYEIPIDNYFVSPKIKATKDSKFSFWAKSHSGFYYGQHFGVAISETNNNSEEYFTTIKDWTITNKEDSDWTKFSVDLSEYEGKDIYVAIRHFFSEAEWYNLTNGYDLYVLYIDDAMLENVIDISQNVTYENYSNFSLNVKSDPIAAPSNVKATAVNENSINITWDAVTNAQSYNLYRDGALVTNVKGTQYTDTNLKPNRGYSYSVTSVLNGEESVTSESVSATTNRASHNIAIKSISPEVLKLGENELQITFVNDGKYEQDSRSTVTLSCSNPNVTILTNNINLNALYVDQESTKSFTMVVGDVPIATPIEFTAHIAQKFSPNYSWDCPFVVMANDPLGVEESKNNENIASIYVRDNNLCINGINGKGYIEIFDISGKILYNETSIEYNTNINLSDFKKGIYIIRIKNANGIKTQKFIY
ncbi:MAG: S8 family serine peptidase, partial [Bacteroidales bacterium]|nr:S8 family serine peptidase [Bacteroidales bacterium]